MKPYYYMHMDYLKGLKIKQAITTEIKHYKLKLSHYIYLHVYKYHDILAGYEGLPILIWFNSDYDMDE